MQQKGFHRKLTAILSADVAGYSRLMQDDEAATVSTLESHKQAFSDLINQHRGRVVDSPGDNLLAEFASVVDAVQCAVAVQKELQARNAELPEDRRMRFRIGVNLGDVIEEGERIYGDGVNIAARLESLADPGGICISKTAFDHIESKLPLGYEFLGEQTVKNITKPVGAYRVVLEPRVTRKKGTGFRGRGSGRRMAVIGVAAVLLAATGVGLWQVFLKPPGPPPPVIEKADPQKMAFPLPDKPSIAVLPFVNMSDDPKQEYFSDGITDEIITALSKLSQILVIARNSTSTYKGKPTSAKEVSEALGVRYVLEGSVRRDGDRVRIGTQLIDALSGHQLWAERYDRSLKDIFSLQDEITLRIVTELRVRLTSGESARMAAKGAKNLDAYLKVLEAADQLGRWTKESNQSAKQLLDEAVALDPDYHLAFLLLSVTRDADVFFGTTESPQRSIQEGVEFAQKAISLDEANGVAYGQLGLLYIRLRQYDEAVEQAEKGAPLGPNNFETNRLAAQVLARAGKVESALPLLDNAIRLNPLPRYTFLIAAGSIYHQAKQYEKALEIYKKAARLEPKNTGGYVGMAATASLTGNMAEARAAIGALHRVDPGYSLEQVKKIFALRGDRDQEPLNRFIEGLKMVGLPERPPPTLPGKASIAVLAFQNMTGDPQQEYFSDGMAEQIITGLSQAPDIYVTARTSSFAYKGKSMTAQQIAEQLGVRYLLEGSVQRDGDRVRINVQLIDGITGNHIWADHFDRKFEDLFALQDALTMEVMAFLNVKFSVGAAGSLKFSRPNNLKAYEHYIKGIYHHQRRNPQDLSTARQLYEEAIKLDPGFGAAYRMLGFVHADEVWFRIAKSPENSLEEAEKAANKCIALTPAQPPPYPLLSMISLLKKDWDNAILYGEKAVQLSPNEAGCYLSLGMALRNVGRFEESIVNLETALRLSPLRPLNTVNNLAWSCVGNKQYDKAILLWNETLERNPDYLFAYQGLAAAYELSGHHEKALWAAENVMRVNPKFSVAVEEKMSAVQDEVYRKRVFDALRRAGLK
jgi:adenylate cyclase